MNHRLIPLSAILAGVMLGAAPAFAAGQAGLSENDMEFVKKAAQGGMAEVELGQIAADKATNPDVQAFAQRMVQDHSMANEKLKAIAQEKGITLPAGIGEDHQELKDKLSGLSGKEFDEAYMDAMEDDHKEDIAAFEEQAEDGDDPQLKQFATDTLPTLKEHGEMANAIEDKVD